MKTSRKLFALTSSLVLCSSFFTALNANAFGYNITRTSEEYQRLLNGYSEVDDHGLFKSWGHWCGLNPTSYNLYVNEQGNKFIYDALDGLSEIRNRFYFEVENYDGNMDSIEETVQAVLDTFDESCGVGYVYDRETKTMEVSFLDYDFNQEKVKMARAVCAKLKEQGLISKFWYVYDYTVELSEITCPNLTAYQTVDNIENKVTKEELVENLSKFVEENKLDCSIVEMSDEEKKAGFGLYSNNRDVIYVKPNKEISLDEHLKLAAQIYDEFGYFSPMDSPESTNSTERSTEIDLFNATYGDLNDDSKLTPVDASLLLSYYSESQIGTETEADMTYEL
ncbi:MAG: hypothetical protein PUB66_06590, partial [Oscillospiraceae bacterium]|nr:hypothetical protein [Oscillospiraceae bacterium]